MSSLLIAIVLIHVLREALLVSLNLVFWFNTTLRRGTLNERYVPISTLLAFGEAFNLRFGWSLSVVTCVVGAILFTIWMILYAALSCLTK